ncbi:MAG: hypothetical protein QME52_09410, partial [Bacteroidota bacterium]|nr:hypothetical protein [Bacteroidota bacterium]
TGSPFIQIYYLKNGQLELLRKNKMSYLFVDFLSEIKTHNFMVYPLGLDVIAQLLLQTTDLEMHDSIIVATAELLQAPLITKDKAIKNYYTNTIW